MLWKERKRERKSLPFSFSLDDVCRMKQLSLELVGKHRQEQMHLRRSWILGKRVVKGHLMPPHLSAYIRGNKKIEQSCVPVEQHWHDGSDSISNSEQPRGSTAVTGGLHSSNSTWAFCVSLYPWHVVCCLLLSSLPQKESPIQFTFVINSTSKVMGKGSKPTINRTKLRFLSQGPKEHAVKSTSHHTWPADFPGLWNLSLGELQQDLEPACWAGTCSPDSPYFSPDFNPFSVLVTIRALFFFLSGSPLNIHRLVLLLNACECTVISVSLDRQERKGPSNKA